jgi:hypothetical protein
VVDNQCLFSSSRRHLSNCTLLGQHPSAELFSDWNGAFVARQLSHSFPLCPKEFFDYLYVCMYTNFSIYFTYFTNSFLFLFLIIFTPLHNYTLTHVSHHVSPTLIINVCSLRQRGKMTVYVHLKCSFLLCSKHRHIEQPLAFLAQSTQCAPLKTKKINKPVL